ncbi:MAG: hypothetical protein H6R19_2192 [Proteobacteria bacterium]|nr:hypothetical protein [Pseudomonadota bacterium]
MRLSFPTSFSWHLPPGMMAWRPDANRALRALTVLLGLLLCWQLAGLLAQVLGWQGSPPALVLPAIPAPDTGSARNALSRWFSNSDVARPANPTSGLQLIAVVAGRRGVALLKGVEPNPVAIAVGQDVRPGLRLVSVLADRVVFEQAGARSELAFPTTPATALIASASSAPATPVAAPVAASAPELPSQSVNVSRGQLAGIAQGGNLGDWDKGLANFAGGGIRVASASEQPLAKVLNLRDGDILKRVNNRDLTQLADISLVYHHFSQSQEVHLTILRDGKQQQLNFKIQP